MLIDEGIVNINLYPLDAAIKARPMPVFPLVASTKTLCAETWDRETSHPGYKERQNETLFVMILSSTLVRNITKAPAASSMHQFHIGHVSSNLVSTLVSVMSINY